MNFTRKNSKQNVGNVLEASKHLHLGDLVLAEDPLIIGPNHVKDSVCLECLANSNLEKCPNCQWALCKICLLNPEKYWHTPQECQRLKDTKELYEAIFPLRLVNEAIVNSEKWQKLSTLQDHCHKKIDSGDWAFLQQKVLPFIMQVIGKPVELDLLFKCLGIICVNAIGIDKDKKRGRALYQNAVLASHNCIPNALHAIDTHGFRIQLKALKSIE